MDMETVNAYHGSSLIRLCSRWAI